MRTNIDLVIGKKMWMEVAEGVKLIIEVLNDKEVKYQFVGDDGAKDAPVVTKLEIVHDHIEDVVDYSFWDGIATRFYLFQFEPIDEADKTINEGCKHAFI